MGRSLVRITALIFASVLLGAVSAQLRGLPWVPDVKKLAEKVAVVDELVQRRAELRRSAGISIDEFKALIAEGAIVIDARTREDFEKSHLKLDTIPPVLHVEPDTLSENLERLNMLFGQPMVLYCNSEKCELAEMLYLGLEKNGFSGMKIFFPGWEGIERAGLERVSGPDTWLGFAAEPEPTATEESAGESPEAAHE